MTVATGAAVKLVTVNKNVTSLPGPLVKVSVIDKSGQATVISGVKLDERPAITLEAARVSGV